MWKGTADNPRSWHRPSAGGRAAAGAALCALALVSCAAVPEVKDDIAAAGETPQIVAADGELSAAGSEAVIAEVADAPDTAGLLARHLAVEEEIAETPLVAGNRTRLLRDGPKTFRVVFDLIRSAEHHVNMEFYILEDVESDGERLGDLLVEKRGQGVAVNVIYDSHGSQETPAAFFDRLRDAGVAVIEYNPLNPLEAKDGYDPNARTHRKILVVDGAAAVTGGINLSRAYLEGGGSWPDAPEADEVTAGDAAGGGSPGDAMAGESPAGEGARGGAADKPDDWRDTSILIEGPVVAQLQGLFLEHWHAQDGPPIDTDGYFPELPPAGDEVVRIIGSSPGHPLPRYYAAVLSAISHAEARVWLTASYFVPTDKELVELKAAAERGVDVRLLLPGVSDIDTTVDIARSHYVNLMESGVRIWETHDVILHSKTVVVDGVWSVVGSSNFDHRSVIFNDEVDAVVLGSATAAELESMFETDLAGAREIDLAAWRDRPFFQRLGEHFSRLWQRWM